MDKVYLYIDKNKWITWVFFALCFWLVIVHLHLNRGLSDLIPGYHYWRKTDTYAQILNYYYNGLRFFDHGIYFNQMESGGKAVAEFPLFYYFIALQLKLFGNHIIILKINWLIIMFLGQIALYKTALFFIKNHILALVIPFSLFLSPLYVIYATEFLPDPIAMHLGFVGLYFLAKHHHNKNKKALIYAVIFIALSGMMKPFYLIPYIAYCIVLVGYRILKKHSLKPYWGLIIPFVLVGFWFLYMDWYNDKHGSHYFLSKLMPYWKYDQVKLDEIWLEISKKWSASYFHPIYFKILIICGAVGLFVAVFKSKLKALFTVLSLLGAAAYFLLLFGMLKQHDYYMFPLLFLAPSLALLYFGQLITFKHHPAVNYVLGAVVIAFMYSGMHYSWFERQARLRNKTINATHEFKPYQNLDHFLCKNNVSENDLVIAFSDKSPSYALMLLNRKGWSGFQTFYRSQNVSKMVDLGAKYLIVNTALPSLRDSVSLKGINMSYVADTNELTIYKLSK